MAKKTLKKQAAPPPPPPPPSTKSGSARMRERGMKLVSVWLNADEYLAVKQFTGRRRQQVATFMREAALDTAGYTLFPKGGQV